MTASIWETCHISSLHIFIPHFLVSALYILYTFDIPLWILPFQVFYCTS
jgi:hypothetical protein